MEGPPSGWPGGPGPAPAFTTEPGLALAQKSCQQQRTASQAFDKILTHNKPPGIFSVPTLMKIFCNALPARQLQKIGFAKKVLKTARPGPALRGRAIRIAKVLLTKKLSTADC